MRRMVLFFALFIIASCSRPFLIDPPGPPDRPEPQVNGRTLSPAMSDTEILDVFGMDISKAESQKVQGRDGYQITYTLGRQKVTVVRSVVSGVFVSAEGPIQGHWNLETGDSDIDL